MTQVSEVPRSSYVGDGSTDSFATGFTFALAAEVVVTVAGTAAAIGVDFDLVGLPAAYLETGADVVFRVGAIPAAAAIVIVERSTPHDQPETFGNDEAISPEQIEALGDRLVRMIQEALLVIGEGEAGPTGPPGAQVELQVTATHIQWRRAGEASWTNLVALSVLTGDDGDAGPAIELQAAGGFIQWRVVGAASWIDLVSLASLTGAQGDPGDPGAPGGDGDDGAPGPRAWTPAAAWLTATAYVVGPPASLVVQGGESYECLVSHTSGVFATDLAAGKWIKVAQKGADGTMTGPGSSTDNAIARFDGAGGANVQDSLITISDAGALGLPDDVRQTFNPGANAAGLNVGAHTGDPASPSNGDVWYNSTSNQFKARINGATVVLGASSGAIGPPQGRLTLTSNTPVMIADATAQSSVYYTPYVGENVPIYDGAAWAMREFAQLTMALDTSNQLSANLYDLFIVNDGGTIKIGAGPAWSSATARGTGAGTTELELKDGIWTNKNSIALKNGAGAAFGTFAANLATYVGTIYCTANGQTGMQFTPAAAAGGSNAFLAVWNAYNRVLTACRSRDSTASWSYTTATWRATNNNNANRISYVDGLAQSRVISSINGAATNGASPSTGGVGAVRDSTSAAPAALGYVAGPNTNASATAADEFAPSLGFHFIQGMETGNGGGTTTWLGFASAPDRQFQHLLVKLEM